MCPHMLCHGDYAPGLTSWRAIPCSLPSPAWLPSLWSSQVPCAHTARPPGPSVWLWCISHTVSQGRGPCQAKATLNRKFLVVGCGVSWPGSTAAELGMIVCDRSTRGQLGTIKCAGQIYDDVISRARLFWVLPPAMCQKLLQRKPHYIKAVYTVYTSVRIYRALAGCRIYAPPPLR